MDGFPFVHQPEAIYPCFFTSVGERKKIEEAFQLVADHLYEGITLLAIIFLFNGIAKDIVDFFAHDFEFTSFGVVHATGKSDQKVDTWLNLLVVRKWPWE